MLILQHAIGVFMAFFAIMNPISNTAAFAGLTANLDKQQQKQIALKALIITFILIALFTFLGEAIFKLFGISLAALRITGGVLVFLVGFHMLQGSTSNMHQAKSQPQTRSSNLPQNPHPSSRQNQASTADDLAISPLAVPLLAGPGTISTAMSYAAMGGIEFKITTIAVFFVLCVITFICFICSSQIIKRIGESGLNIVTRLMGLILAVIGVQMLITGVQGVSW